MRRNFLSSSTSQKSFATARIASLLSTSGFRLLASGFFPLLLLSGCAPTQATRDTEQAVADYFTGDYAASVQLLQPLAAKTDENFVLNNCRLGSAALADYDLRDASDAFLRAYEVINSVGVNNGGRSLGAALVDEKIKVWKGEPFERAMANFYLGLIYYMQHDYANARAAFQNALFKLRDYGEEKDKNDEYRTVESNFAIAYLMLGRCYQRLDQPDEANKAFARAVELRSYLAPLASYELNAKSNVLLVIDYGYGPIKSRNYDGAFVGFRPTPGAAGPVLDPVVSVDGAPQNLNAIARPPFDLLALAQDRRWQSIDTIRAIKTTVGTGLIAAGAYEGLRRQFGSGAGPGPGCRRPPAESVEHRRHPAMGNAAPHHFHDSAVDAAGHT